MWILSIWWNIEYSRLHSRSTLQIIKYLHFIFWDSLRGNQQNFNWNLRWTKRENLSINQISFHYYKFTVCQTLGYWIKDFRWNEFCIFKEIYFFKEVLECLFSIYSILINPSRKVKKRSEPNIALEAHQLALYV